MNSSGLDFFFFFLLFLLPWIDSELSVHIFIYISIVIKKTNSFERGGGCGGLERL